MDVKLGNLLKFEGGLNDRQHRTRMHENLDSGILSMFRFFNAVDCYNVVVLN